MEKPSQRMQIQDVKSLVEWKLYVTIPWISVCSCCKHLAQLLCLGLVLNAKADTSHLQKAWQVSTHLDEAGVLK